MDLFRFTKNGAEPTHTTVETRCFRAQGGELVPTAVQSGLPWYETIDEGYELMNLPGE